MSYAPEQFLDGDFALPDPDQITTDLSEVCGVLDVLLGTVRGTVTQRLAMAQGAVSDILVAIEDCLKDQFLNSWRTIDELKTCVSDKIASEIGEARSLAAISGTLGAYTPAPGTGSTTGRPIPTPSPAIPAPGFVPPPLGVPGEEPKPVPLPVPLPFPPERPLPPGAPGPPQVFPERISSATVTPSEVGQPGGGCGVEWYDGFKWWCITHRFTTTFVCAYVTRVQLELMCSQGAQIVSGPYDSQEDCEKSCPTGNGGGVPPAPPPGEPPPPTVTDYWCCRDTTGGTYCLKHEHLVGDTTPPCPDVVAGPFPSQTACMSACELQPQPPPGETWYCICDVASGAKQCHRGGTEPPAGWVICSEPFASQTECEAQCKAEGGTPSAGWYCLPDGKCVLTTSPPAGALGPFASETECISACRGRSAPPGGLCCEPPPPCPPPPVIPPCPPVYVFPPGGGIITEPPPETPEEKEKKECEKKKCKEDITWRAWLTCDDVCYITAGNQPPRDSTDKLLCKTESLESAMACCPAKKCPENKKPQQCGIVADGKMGSLTPGTISPTGGTCPGAPSVLNPWDSLEACHDIDSQIGFISPPSQCELGYWLGLTGPDGKPVKHSTDEGLSQIGVWINDALSALLGNIVCSIENLVRSVAGGDRCSGQRQFGLDIKYALLSWIERLGAANMDRYTNPIRYEQNYLCPSVLPSAGDTTAAWLRNEISDDVWACWTKANGALFTPASKIRDASRSMHTVGDIVRLWLRDVIKDEQLDSRLRTLGYIKESDYSEIRELSKQYPPYTDIIRLMVRDAADNSIVDWPDSDALWEKKYAGDLQKWGKFQGIPDEVTKLLWRAHWSIPAPGQLNTIWQRERKRGDTIAGTDLGKQISDALLQQDILPRWIPHLIGINYRVLGRVDIRRAYQIGVLSREQVDSAYIRLGHDDDSATALTEFTVRQARLALRQHSAVRSYLEFGLSRDQANEELTDYGASPEDIDWVLDWALRRARAKSRTVCAKAAKKQFTTGGIDDAEFTAQLRGLGLDDEQIDIALSTAQCESKSRGRTVQAATLCKWLEYGIIDPAEYHQRLLRIGWNGPDATKLVASCAQALSIRQSREQMRRQRDQDAAQKRADRERIALAKELQREADRAQRAAAAATARKEQREKIMLKAAGLLQDKCGLPLSSATILVRDGVARARAAGSTANEATYAALRAAEQLTLEGCEGYLSLVDEYAMAEETMGTVADSGNGGAVTITPR